MVVSVTTNKCFFEERKIDLESLVGLTVKEAKKIIRKAGFKTNTYQHGDYQHGEIVISLSISENVVQLWFDKTEKGDIITRAETQASIDAKCQSNL